MGDRRDHGVRTREGGEGPGVRGEQRAEAPVTAGSGERALAADAGSAGRRGARAASPTAPTARPRVRAARACGTRAARKQEQAEPRHCAPRRALGHRMPRRGSPRGSPKLTVSTSLRYLGDWPPSAA
ncbi:hypothetical protein NN561_007809 [Cricetulus griseus]